MEKEKQTVSVFRTEENQEVVVTAGIIYSEVGTVTACTVISSNLPKENMDKFMAGMQNLAENTNSLFSLEKFYFTVPNYEQLTNYRIKSSEIESDTGNTFVNPLQMRSYYLINHLKKWTLKNEKGEIVELTHKKDGALTSDSIGIINKVPPTILDNVIEKYEQLMKI